MNLVLREIDDGKKIIKKDFVYKCLSIEIQASAKEPSTVEEAKVLLAVKNSIITKMRNQLASYSSLTMIKEQGSSESDQKLIQYLQHENSRLENKLLLLQTELDVEKNKAEQIKEVN